MNKKEIFDPIPGKKYTFRFPGHEKEEILMRHEGRGNFSGGRFSNKKYNFEINGNLDPFYVTGFRGQIPGDRWVDSFTINDFEVKLDESRKRSAEIIKSLDKADEVNLYVWPDNVFCSFRVLDYLDESYYDKTFVLYSPECTLSVQISECNFFSIRMATPTEFREDKMNLLVVDDDVDETELGEWMKTYSGDGSSFVLEDAYRAYKDMKDGLTRFNDAS